MVAQMNVQQVHKILKYTMDTFAEKKGKDYVEAMSVGYEYFSKIRKKWMS